MRFVNFNVIIKYSWFVQITFVFLRPESNCNVVWYYLHQIPPLLFLQSRDPPGTSKTRQPHPWHHNTWRTFAWSFILIGWLTGGSHEQKWLEAGLCCGILNVTTLPVREFRLLWGHGFEFCSGVWGSFLPKRIPNVRFLLFIMVYQFFKFLCKYVGIFLLCNVHVNEWIKLATPA